MKKLLAKSDYHSNRFHCSAGDIVEVSDELAAWLANDAPGVFVPVDLTIAMPKEEEEEGRKAADKPPMDKAIRKAPRKK